MKDETFEDKQEISESEIDQTNAPMANEVPEEEK